MTETSLADLIDKDLDRPSGPLSGTVVVDLTRVLAGPYCTLLLYDLGATIIKVERPGTGDDARQIGPFVNGTSAYFASLNRGKRSLALDLKSDTDCKIFEQLMARADILVENSRAGTMEKLGYGWDTIHPRFPNLIYAAASGFGHSGPYRTRPAYDLVVQAMGGMMSLTGHPQTPPTRVGTSIGDLAAGLFAAIGITSALTHRHKTGEATKVDVAMLDGQVALLENAIARFASTGQVPQPLGSRHPSIAPFEAFHTKDGNIVVAVGNDGLFTTFAKAIGAPEFVDDPRFATNDLRCQNVDDLKTEIEIRLAARTTPAWLNVFESAGIPCGPINDVAQVLEDPQIRARNMIVTADDPVAGTLKMAGNPIKFDAFEDPSTRPAAPALDADRDLILNALNG